MPFGLKFKRTRRYDISTKNIFVVGVEMPDHSYLECTLNSDSTGQECLDSIAQRIELAQTQYFGLRYVTKKLQYHWVDLSKPLKKQLDKNVQLSPSPRLYFGVMFYIQGAHKIADDVARYQYFLQLKNDIVEGRIPMTVQQVLRLASFSLQAEFGDYEYDKPAQDYFDDNQLFPKTMCRDENTVGEMMNEAINGYASLQGIHPVKAEVQYIKEVQLMDGYGMEYYTAKDDKGKELYLGTSYSGLLARYLDGSPTICFRWTEIARITQSKKVLEIDTSKSSYQYALEDTDTAKYLKRMGYLLQKFYKSNKGTPSSSIIDLNELPDGDNSMQDTNQVTHQQVFSDHLTHSQTSLTYSQHSQQSHDQRYDQDLSQSSIEDFYRQSQQSLETSSSIDVPQQQTENFPAVSNGMYSPAVQPQEPQIEQQYQNKHVVLPAYRPSPSYDDVMRQRMTQQHQHQHPMHSNQPQHQPGIVQDTHIYQQQGENIVYTPRDLGPDVTYTQEGPYVNSESVQMYDNKTMYANVFQDEKNHYLQLQSNERTSNLILQPTYSSPELTTQVFPQQYSSDNMLHEAMPYQYKPPPPYPLHSSSTPDLAAQTVRSNTSDSPDLVSRKNLGLSASGLQSNLDKSLENLSEVVQLPREEIPPVQGQIIQNVIEMPQISVSQVETDDGSSDHSGATFHVRDTDSEMEETSDRTPKRENSKTEIAIKFVAPNKAPPPSTSKEVITRRESFRRQMIARAGQFNPNATTTDDVASLASKVDENVIPEHLDSSSNENVNVEQPGVRKSNSADYEQPAFTRRFSSRRISRRSNASVKDTDRNVKHETSDVREKLLDLQIVPPPPSEMNFDVKEAVSSPQVEEEYESSSDSDFEKDATIKFKMGPLKMAAMNGLTLSRPMVLALMNDESRAPKDERRKILENKLSENLVFKEFEEIPKKVPTMECSVSKLQENESRNRFKDVLPYDATRVKLTPRKENHSGYVNASHVKLSVGDRVWWYIATQAPMKDTTVDFWQMVWEQEVDVIAMLTDLTELGKQKCFPYWPQEVGTEHKILFGQYEVTLLFCNDSLCYITNRISIVHVPSKKERQVWHLQYTDWPDHGCPEDMYGFLGFLDEVESVQRLAESEEGSGKKSPILVHCSAGVGRTGVVILTQVMKWCLEHNHDIDLPKALGAIRNQRMFMVQTLGQYNFIHKTLIQYLKNTRLI